MKFIVDAHLPFYWKTKLVEKGHDAIHTSELPRQNRTDDFEIIEISLEESRIVIKRQGFP
jgi:predicted nuclease of predicted toxin-antitoxin system